MSRLGISLPSALGLRDAIDIAAVAEALGYTDVWSAEVSGYDAFTPLAAVCARTQRIRLGTAVVPAATRPPALLAMTAASLHDLSNGRFCLGLGSSTPAIVERWMGIPFPASLTRMRETLTVLRSALAGEKTSLQGETLSVRAFRLDGDPRVVPLMIGALGARMTRLAGELADGLIMTMASPEAIPSIVSEFHAGAVAAGRSTERLDVVLNVPVVLDEGPEALEQVRASLGSYGMLPVYNRYLARHGFEAEAAAMRAAFETRSWTDGTAAVSDRMLRALSVSGDLATCRDQLAGYREAGVQTLLLNPVVLATDPAERKRRFVSALEKLAGI